ncbi:MAG: group III truncated hemoglobin [Hyphomicrobiaceae bacterium]
MSHDRSHDRRASAPGFAVGIDEAAIRTLVHAFYARVRRDPLLGPIFNAKVADWDEHLAKLCDFWSSVTLMSGRYKGTPMHAHAAIPEIAPHHFEQWLNLFRETAREHCQPAAADLFIDRAERIAQSLEMGIALTRGTGPLATLRAVAGTPKTSGA